MFGQIGGLNAVGAPLPNNQIGGENFIRHIGNDKLIFDFHEGNGTTVHDKSHCGNNGVFATAPTKASVYPPAQNDTYVKATSKVSTGFWAYFATDPAKSLTGNYSGNSWLSDTGNNTNQRFHIDLGSAKIIKRIYYENGHSLGGGTDKGARNFTFWGSNTASSFAELTYGTDTGWTELTVSQNTFDEHTGSDVADPKYITVTNTTAYRYYAIKFVDNYGSGSYIGIRRIELQIDTYPSHPTWKRNSLYFDGGDNINCGNDASLDITDAITVKVFVKFDSLTNHDMIISKTSLAALNVGWGVEYYNSAIRFFIESWDTNFATLSFTDIKNWNFIVGTYDKNAGSNEININVNNVLGTPDTLSDAITGEATSVVIGEGFASNFFDGYVKNIRIIAKALSQIEIQQEYLVNKFSNN